jgi:hypothetical protein
LTRRLVVVPPTAIGPVRDEVVRGMERFTALASSRGFTIVDGAPALAETLAHGFAIYQRLRALTDGQDGVRSLAAGREHLLSDSTRAILAAAVASTEDADPDEVAGLVVQADTFRARVRGFLTGADALVMPVAATGAIGFAETVEVGGTPMDGFTLSTFVRAVTLTGLPALSFPVGQYVSTQIVAADRGELDALGHRRRAGGSPGFEEPSPPGRPRLVITREHEAVPGGESDRVEYGHPEGVLPLLGVPRRHEIGAERHDRVRSGGRHGLDHAPDPVGRHGAELPVSTS